MSAATFWASRAAVDYSQAISVSDLGVTAIVVVTFLVLGFALYSSLLDQQLSAQQALADELYRSRQMLQSILDNIPQRVFWKDLDGRYQGCNRAFALDSGLSSPEEAVGKIDEELPALKVSLPFSDDLRRTVETGQPVSNSEYEMTSGNGPRRWVRVTSIPLRDSTGKICGTLGAYEDITEHKQAEDAVKRSNAALSEFAHVVSHDLQSPLRVANNYAQLLGTVCAAELNEEAHTFLGFIETSLRNMSELIQSLLRYSTATDAEPEGRRAVALASVLDRALANAAVLINETDAKITSGPLPELVGNPVQLTQVMQNLISNAIKYRKSTVRPVIHVAATDEGDEWVISVRDNGIGIASHHHNRIFNPLKRLHGPEIPGFGIGLATCRRVVEHHGGRIWVESEPGAGSTFYFSIQKQHASGEAADQSPVAPGGTMTRSAPA
jgi:PAS domain S-box-containing protein